MGFSLTSFKKFQKRTLRPLIFTQAIFTLHNPDYPLFTIHYPLVSEMTMMLIILRNDGIVLRNNFVHCKVADWVSHMTSRELSNRKDYKEDPWNCNLDATTSKQWKAPLFGMGWVIPNMYRAADKLWMCLVKGACKLMLKSRHNTKEQSNLSSLFSELRRSTYTLRAPGSFV